MKTKLVSKLCSRPFDSMVNVREFNLTYMEYSFNWYILVSLFSFYQPWSFDWSSIEIKFTSFLTATLAKKLGCFANDIFVEKTGMFCRRYCFSLFKEPDCWKMTKPGLLLFILVLFKQIFYSKTTYNFSGIRTCIMREEVEHADHSTTITTAQLVR